MFDIARSALESFRSQWKSGEHQDDFELSMFAAAQEEYESGAGHKGLLAKISAETGFDDNQTKASYMKARTAQLMGKREAILGAMLKIQKLDVEIERIQGLVSLLNDDAIIYQSEPSPKVIDDVVSGIEKRHKYKVINISEGGKWGIGAIAMTSAFMLFAIALLGLNSVYWQYAGFGLTLVAVTVWYSIRYTSNTTKKEMNQELIRYQAEITDTAEISRVALRIQNAERQDHLTSVERTEQSLKNLIATRENTASTLEGLFG